MDNTIQLYLDKEKQIKGYPITSPDRVVDENGVNIKEQFNKSVKFKVVGEGTTVPPISGGGSYSYDDTEIREMINETNASLDNNTKKINYIDNYVTPQMYGAKADGIADDTTAIEKAFKSGKYVYLPNGVYRFTTLELFSNLKVIGENREKTILKVLQSNNPSAITVKKGANVEIYLDGFTIDGGFINTNQNGLYVHGRFDDGRIHGGLWRSVFRNIRILNFQGIGLGLISDFTNAFTPIQANLFEFVSVNSSAKTYANSIPCQISGQVEQCAFLRCGFSGNSNTSDVLSGTCALKLVSVDSTVNDPISGHILAFYECYFGQCEYGIYGSRCVNVNFDSPYFENTKCDAYCDKAGTMTINNPTLYGNSLNGYNFYATNSGTIAISNCLSENLRVSNRVITSNCPYVKYINTPATTLVSETLKVQVKHVALTGTGIIKKFEIGFDEMLLQSASVFTIENNTNILTSTNANITTSIGKMYLVKKLLGSEKVYVQAL